VLLAGSRGSFAACILILALGLGGATAAFSALYSVVLRPLPYPDPDSLVAIRTFLARLTHKSAGAAKAELAAESGFRVPLFYL
jgi:hypothetical protein